MIILYYNACFSYCSAKNRNSSLVQSLIAASLIQVRVQSSTLYTCIMISHLLLISLLFYNHGLALSEKRYHIIHSVGDFCPEDPCLTLSQFADNSSIYIDSNTTLIFTSGTHTFNSLVSIEHVDTISMLSNTSSTISLLWFSLSSVSHIFIDSLTFLHCKLQFDSIKTLTVENCTFLNNTWTALELEHSSAYIANSQFISNLGDSEYLTINGSLRSYSAGAVVIMRSLSTFVCKDCLFLLNNAEVGGVAYARLRCNLTFINCSFEGNHARKLGGVLYSEKFCTVSIYNSTFQNNSAGDKGGVFSVTQTDVFINMCGFSHCKSKEGGVIYAEMGILFSFISNVGGIMVISGSKFVNNSASSVGGVLAAKSMNVTINGHSRFINNTAAHNGGAVYINTGHIRISGSMFSSCTADNNGGVLASLGSAVLIQKSVFHHNRATINGGVLFTCRKHPKSNQGSVIITECDFCGNSAEFGGVLQSEGIRVSFINCSKVESNRAGFGGVMEISEVDQMIVYGSILSNNTAELVGGALMLSNNFITRISNSLLIGNSADYSGGAVYMETNNASFSNCDFDSNTATETGGAIDAELASNFDISASIIRNNVAQIGAGIFCSDKSLIITNNITITQNAITKQGTLFFLESNVTFTHITSVSDNVGSLFFFYSSAVFRGTTLINSSTSKEGELTTLEGGAITAFQSTVDLEGLIILRGNSASKGGAIYAASSKLYVSGNTLISNNSALNSGGGIYLQQSELYCGGKSSLDVLGNNAINKGGGIHAISSTITAEYRYPFLTMQYAGSKVNLINNRVARIGGGICLENNAKVKILNVEQATYTKPEQVYTMVFHGNMAEHGGAIYVADDTTSGTCVSASYQIHSPVSECFLQVTQLLSVTWTGKDGKIGKTIHIDFMNNSAAIRGSNLYGGLLDRCTQNPLNEATKTHPNITNGLQHLVEFSSINSFDSISSDPVQVCFCNNNQPDCLYQPPTVNITKGETFIISLVAVDQASHVISAAIHGFPISDESGIGEGQLIQDAADECTNLTYNVFSPHSNEKLVIFADGPCKDAPLSQRRIQIKFLPCTCPIGFKPDLQDEIRCVCECDSKLNRYITKCDFKTQSLVRQGQSWISYVKTKPANFSDYIIYPYCPLNYCKSNAELNLSSQNGIDAQCAAFRTGTLCGACQPHYSLSLGSTRCIECPRYWLAIFVTILVASILAGLALVAVILVLNLTVAVGTLNGVIFYANIVYANIHTFHPDDKSSFATVFVSWLNLDIGIDACFIKRMDDYWKTWLQLVFPSYMFFLVIMVIFISNRSRRFSELIGKKNPVATLATLILLSYAKILHIIITAFSSATLNYPGPNGGYKRKVWLRDATVDYLKGKHVPLFLAAIFILLAGIVYTTLLFSWQWLLHFNKGSKVLKWTRNPKVSGFIEIYHAPYTPRNRYWTGLLLFVRVILYIASAANVSGDPKINLLTIGSVITGVLLISKLVGIGDCVYKKWSIEILEVASYVNLLLLSLATFFSLGNIRARKAVTNTSVSIMFLLLLCVLFYHVYTELIMKQWKKANHQTQLSVAIEQFEGISDHSESFQMSSTTSTVVDAPKKIQSTNYATNNELREALLDYSDN